MTEISGMGGAVVALLAIFIALIWIICLLNDIKKNQEIAIDRAEIALELKYLSEHPAYKQFCDPAVYKEIIRCGKRGYENLSPSYKFAIGAFIRRMEFTHRYKDLFFVDDEEWQMTGKNDILEAMNIPAIRQHWLKCSQWYTEDFQHYLYDLLNKG